MFAAKSEVAQLSTFEKLHQIASWETAHNQFQLQQGKIRAFLDFLIDPVVIFSPPKITPSPTTSAQISARDLMSPSPNAKISARKRKGVLHSTLPQALPLTASFGVVPSPFRLPLAQTTQNLVDIFTIKWEVRICARSQIKWTLGSDVSPISKFSHLSNSWNAGSWLNSTLTFCDKDCPNIGYDRDLSFSDCGSACEDKEGCNAFNFHENPPNCYLRKCPIPAPTPTWNFASDDEFLPNFDGYYWTKSDDKFFEDSQCPNIDSRSGLSITECIDECNEEKGCTAVNYAQRQDNFFL